MTQPTERRFVMEPRLDAEVETINDALATKVETTDARLSDQRVPLDNSVTSAKIVNGTIVNADIADTTIESAKLAAQDYIKFDTTYTGGSTQAGELAWDPDNETLEFMLDDHVTLQIGQEHVIRVKNNSTSVAIPERTVVMFAGAAGDTIKVSPAVSDGSINVNYLAGITTEQIDADGFGFITQLGFINQVNTNGWAVGTLLYVDPTTPGGLTSTEPDAPAWTMPVAAVTKQNASAGRILVRSIPGGSGAGGGAAVNVADTAPVGGNPGDMWFDSTDGTLYVYYEDVDGSQWVQVQANSALTAGIESRVGALESQAIAFGALSPNYIINGGFDIWQRGTSFSSSGYSADRWQYVPGATGTLTQQATGMDGFQYCARYQRTSGNTTAGYQQFFYTMETKDSIPLAGKTVTLSFYARAGANFSASANALSLQLRTGTSTDQSATSMGTNTISQTATLTTSWQRFSYTATIPSATTGIGINLYYLTAGTAGANDYFEVTGVQLERSSTATSFRRNANSIQAELAACQRYYWRTNVSGVYASVGAGMVANNTTDARVHVQFPTIMRTSPSVIEWAGMYLGDVYSQAFAVTSISILPASTYGTVVGVTCSGGGMTQYRPTLLHSEAVSTAYFGVSAEL